MVFDPATGKVSVDYTKIKANDETLDAFTAHVNNLKVTGPVAQSITLKRPWAQVNYGTTPADLKAARLASIDIKQSKVVVDNVYQTLNLLDGTVSDPTTANITLAAANIPTAQNTFSVEIDNATPAATATYGKLHVDNNDGVSTNDDYVYLGLNYLLVGGEADTQSLIKADLELFDANGSVNAIAFSNVPVQRNYRTNIVGNLLTSQVEFNIHIDANYDDDLIVNTTTTTDAAGNVFTESQDENGNVIALDANVTTDEGLSQALTNTDAKNINVTVEDDNLQVNFGARKNWGGDNTENVTIDGNGKTITLGGTDSDWSSIGSKNGTLTIKNATIKFVRVNGGNNAWNNHALNFSGKVIAENVTFTNSVSVVDEASFTGCTFTEEGAFYTLIIKATTSNVVVDNCTFTATNGGRGIKWMDQYIDEANRVQGTLTISNATFTTAKKAAILVTNTAGAKIVADNLNITAVAEDNVNAVWVDEDRSAAFDLVEVTGCTKKQE